MSGKTTLAANAAGVMASCLFGASVVATRTAVEEIPPISLAFLRYGLGAAILTAVLLFGRQTPLPLHREAIRSCAILGVIMYVIFPVVFNTSLEYTTASRGAVILATMPLWTALLARRSGVERLDSTQSLGILVSISGIAVVFADSGLNVAANRDVLIGNLLMVLVAISGGVYGVLAKPLLGKYGALEVTATAMGIGAVILLIPAILEGLLQSVATASVRTLALTLFLGTFGGAVAFWLLTYSLSRLSPTQAMIYINLNPLVATFLGAVLLDEQLTLWFVVGFVIVLSGLMMMNATALLQRRSPTTRSA